MTRKFYFTITLPQKIKQKQTPFPELYYEDCRYIKKASSYETDHFDCDAPQGRRTTACLPEHPPVPVNIITSGLLSIYLLIYLFIFNPVNELGASEKVIKKNNGLDRSKLYLPIYSSELQTIIYSPFTRG